MSRRLYHYTNAAGLDGILKSKTIFMTDYRFLNDSTEFSVGSNLMRLQILSRKEDLDSAMAGSSLMANSLFSDNTLEVQFCLVGCLSKNGDLLSQWRGYNSGKRYSIGFNREWLDQNAKEQKITFTSVMYESHERLASKIVDVLISDISRLEGDTGRLDETVRNWWEKALHAALVFKDINFKEENEERLIYISHGLPSNLKFRHNSSGLIPFIPFKLDVLQSKENSRGGRNDGIEEIIVGPSLKYHQIHAINALLDSYNIVADVKKSKIPYVAD